MDQDYWARYRALRDAQPQPQPQQPPERMYIAKLTANDVECIRHALQNMVDDYGASPETTSAVERIERLYIQVLQARGEL